MVAILVALGIATWLGAKFIAHQRITHHCQLVAANDDEHIGALKAKISALEVRNASLKDTIQKTTMYRILYDEQPDYAANTINSINSTI